MKWDLFGFRQKYVTLPKQTPSEMFDIADTTLTVDMRFELEPSFLASFERTRSGSVGTE